MKKIGIVTINDYNFGNRLQNYAMLKVLSNYGDVENIVRYFDAENLTFAASLKKKIKKFIKTIIGRLKKYRNFDKFNKKYIKNSKYKFSKNLNYNKLNNYFDYFVAGSDQVWNPIFFKNNMYINMLGFTPCEKRIAVAPSIAIETLNEEQQSEFKKYLSNFKALSCREQQGSELITSLINKEVQTLIDPTLMLSADDWDKVIVKPKCHNEKEKYILLYFLGTMTKEYEEKIDNLSKKFKLKIINLKLDTNYLDCGPSEFVYLIKNAQLVITDSFHGSVFSVLYDRPLLILERQEKYLKSMNTRITNLLDKLHLNDNVYTNANKVISLDVKYDKTYLKLEQEKVKEFLNKNICEQK